MSSSSTTFSSTASETERLENIRLVFRREIDRLGVTAAFDVEDAVVAPDMLVVADEVALRVGGKRRLARAAQPEQRDEELPLCLSAVAEQCIESRPRFGREVIRHRENALLHLAGVFGAENDEFPVFEAEVNARLGINAGGEAIRWELAGIVDGEVRLAEVRQFLPSSVGSSIVCMNSA